LIPMQVLREGIHVLQDPGGIAVGKVMSPEKRLQLLIRKGKSPQPSPGIRKTPRSEGAILPLAFNDV
jgi:hypothetical protein